MPIITLECEKCGKTRDVFIPPRADLPGPCGSKIRTVKDYTTCPFCGSEMKNKDILKP